MQQQSLATPAKPAIDTILKDIPEDIKAGTATLYDGPEGLVLMPETQGAYAYWAQDTTWKTVSEKLARYFTLALMTTPTVIFIPHTAQTISIPVKGRPKSDSLVDRTTFRLKSYFGLAAKGIREVPPKYQATALGLRDTLDNPLIRLPDELLPLLAAIENQRTRRTIFMNMPLDLVPEEGRSVAILLNAAQSQAGDRSAYNQVMTEIPATLWSRPFFCEQVIKTSFWAFDSMPDTSKSETLCLRAAKDTADLEEFEDVLRNIPQNIWEKPYFGAHIVNMDWHGFNFIPDHCKTPAICLKAATDTADFDEFMEVVNDIPGHIWSDSSFCLKMLDQDGRVFESIPDACKTADICIRAAKATEDSDELETIVNDIPDHVWQDPAFAPQIVEYDWHSFENVPDRYKTSAVCLIAARGTEDADEFAEIADNVPGRLWSNVDFSIAMVSKDWHALSNIPTASKNTDICLAALKATSDEDEFMEALDEVPGLLFADPGFSAATVAMNWRVIESIPTKYIDANICLSAARATENIDDFVEVIDNSPGTLWNEPEFCRAMVEDCNHALAYVPAPNRTKELCILALISDKEDELGYLVPKPYWNDRDFCIRAGYTDPGPNRKPEPR